MGFTDANGTEERKRCSTSLQMEWVVRKEYVHPSARVPCIPKRNGHQSDESRYPRKEAYCQPPFHLEPEGGSSVQSSSVRKAGKRAGFWDQRAKTSSSTEGGREMEGRSSDSVFNIWEVVSTYTLYTLQYSLKMILFTLLMIVILDEFDSEYYPKTFFIFSTYFNSWLFKLLIRGSHHFLFFSLIFCSYVYEILFPN